ncbi:MAG: twitch domain-containing radical SAM protein [Chitinophagales bacterium]|nr:twitch domain-containing radical SAM protein [Chitinophagales bacterium]
MLTKDQINAYNTVRQKHAIGLICHAPFSSLNFEQNGNVSACCYNRSFSLGKIPDQTIDEIWTGARANELRKYMRDNDLSGGCSTCEMQIQSGNYQGTKAIYYDEFANKPSLKDKIKNIFQPSKSISMPKLFEFELSNSCNLECTMCNGYFSSAIRKNREHLPAMKNHYTDDFVEQLIPYLPHLKDAKFLGGEPFLIEIYYKIWEKIIEINPQIKVHITTNGTVANKKAKAVLEKLNAGIIVSIDSLNKKNYEAIRVNAKLDEVLKNLEYFQEYTYRKDTYLSIAVCPIVSNRFDMPEMVHFCNKNEIHIHFNTVWTPEHTSLRFLDSQKLKEVIDFYNSSQFESKSKLQRENIIKFRNFTSQLETWLAESEAQDQVSENIKALQDVIISLDEKDIKKYAVLQSELNYYKCAEDTNRHNETLRELCQEMGYTSFLTSYMESMIYVASKILKTDELKQFEEKANEILNISLQVDDLKMVSEEMIRAGFVFQMHFIQKTDASELLALAKNRFLAQSTQ